MKHEIKLTTCVVAIDESASLSDMQEGCPVFFRTPLGKRETYTVYRGCLIVRNTVQFTGNKPKRKTTVYLYLPEGFPDSKRPNTSCISVGHDSVKSIEQAKRLIDRVIETGETT
jgi:hypothetical protein